MQSPNPYGEVNRQPQNQNPYGEVNVQPQNQNPYEKVNTQPQNQDNKSVYSNDTDDFDNTNNAEVSSVKTVHPQNMPVSYTHLDVYKRQRTGRGRNLFMNYMKLFQQIVFLSVTLRSL